MESYSAVRRLMNGMVWLDGVCVRHIAIANLEESVNYLLKNPLIENYGPECAN